MKGKAEKALLRLFENDKLDVKDKVLQASNHSYYSAYIPIRTQSAFDDELTTTFPYLKYLKEQLKIEKKGLIEEEIHENMKKHKAEGTVDVGWQKCLDTFLCTVDVQQATEIYLELKRKGTYVLEDLKKKYNQKCTLPVFFQRYFPSNIESSK